MRCILARTQEPLAQQVEMATTYFTRLKGLMFRKQFDKGSVLVLDPCPQIHTCFMRFELDALFCAPDGTVLHVVEKMKPWHFSKFVRGARYTLEFAGGTLNGRVQTGDKILF